MQNNYIVGDKEYAKYLFQEETESQKWQEQLQKTYNPGKAGQVLGDIGSGIGQSALYSHFGYSSIFLFTVSVLYQGIVQFISRYQPRKFAPFFCGVSGVNVEPCFTEYLLPKQMTSCVDDSIFCLRSRTLQYIKHDTAAISRTDRIITHHKLSCHHHFTFCSFVGELSYKSINVPLAKANRNILQTSKTFIFTSIKPYWRIL